MHFVAIIFIFSIGACWGDDYPRIAVNSSGEPDIDGSTVSVPITEINLPTNSVTNSTTIPTTTTTTTTASTTTSTTRTTGTSTTTTTELTPTGSQAPKHSTASPYIDRKFDGPSFTGGIILSIGVMAIAVFAWKFYKSRSEQNYHTL